MKRLVVIDSHSILFKSHFAFIRNQLRNSKGMTTSALFGFLKTFQVIVKKLEPDYLLFAFDKSRDTFRRKMYEPYKAHRESCPEELAEQLPFAPKIAEALGCQVLMYDDYEADDILGSAAHQFTERHEDLEAYLFTGDRDSYQLVRDRVKIAYASSKSKDGMDIIDLDAIDEKYGLQPPSLIQVKALQGDSSDNIPGVKGVGEKTALKLIKEYETLDNLYDDVENIKGKLKEKLENDKELAYISEKLARIKTDIDLGITLDNLTWDLEPTEELIDLFHELEFQTLLKGFFDGQDFTGSAKVKEEPQVEKEFTLILKEEELEILISQMSKAKLIAFDTETDSLDANLAKLVGMSFCFEEHKAYYIPFRHHYLGAPKQLKMELVLEKLRPLFNDKSKLWVAHNLKYDMNVLHKYEMGFPENFCDTLIQAHLLFPTERHGLKHLSQRFLSVNRDRYGDIVEEDQNFASIDVKTACDYAGADAEDTFQLYHFFQKKLEEKPGVQNLLEKIELPLVQTLETMERNGVKINKAYFESLSTELAKESEALKEDILDEAGVEFNLNSTKQLAQVLFEKMGIEPIKKTKTGFSTATDVLEQLAPMYPICEKITRYRHLVKLLNTYVIPIPKLCDREDLIHSSFHQNVAATGRLSSTNPNLQNIPVRSEWGRRIRQGFLPRNEEWKFVAIDYSQIELRILAELAEEDNLRQAFENGRDIHLETAANINRIPLEDVSKQEREEAKAINFGIIYGISPFGLSRQLRITQAKARSIIDAYFEIFPGVKRFMDETSEMALEQGFVSTHFGRIREIEELKSKNKTTLNSGKRIAINTRIQGTAAELIKMAMVSVDEHIKQEALNGRLLIQVHDELIFELPESEMEQVARIKKLMETVVEFKVPIVCDVEVGPNWGELESYQV